MDAAALPPIIAIVETAAGLQESAEIATAPGVWALLLGAVDLGVELRLTPRADGLELLFARSKLVVDSAAAQIAPPIDVVHVDIADDDALRAESELARSLGFGGKACIHPRQVPIVERAFAPTADELERARRVVDAYEAARSPRRGRRPRRRRDGRSARLSSARWTSSASDSSGARDERRRPTAASTSG